MKRCLYELVTDCGGSSEYFTSLKAAQAGRRCYGEGDIFKVYVSPRLKGLTLAAALLNDQGWMACREFFGKDQGK